MDIPPIPVEAIKGWIRERANTIGWLGFDDCNNIIISKDEVASFLGWTKITGLSNAIVGEIREIQIYNKGDATESVIIITETHAYKYVPPTTITDITDVVFGANQERIFSGQLGDFFVFTNNTSHVKKFTGAAPIADLGGLAAINVTAAKTLCVCNQFILIGNLVIGGTRFNKTVAWCDRNAPETWVPSLSNMAGDLDLDEDSSELLALQPFGSLADVGGYKGKAIYILEYEGLPNVWGRRRFTAGRGIIAPDAILEHDGIHYFVGDDLDIYKFNGVSQPEALGNLRGIQKFLNMMTDQTKLNQVHAFYHDQDMIFSFPARSTNASFAPANRFAISYNPIEDKFARRDDIATAGSFYKQASATTVFDGLTQLMDDANGVPSDVYGIDGIPPYKTLIGDKDGNIYKYGIGGSLDGLDYESFIETGDENFKQLYLPLKYMGPALFQLQAIQIEANQLGVKYPCNVKVGTKESFNRNVTWLSPASFIPNSQNSAYVKPRAMGQSFRLRIGTSKKNQSWSFKSIAPEAELIGTTLR